MAVSLNAGSLVHHCVNIHPKHHHQRKNTMGKMKNLVNDILEMYGKGYSVTEIADLYEMRLETVVSVIETYGGYAAEGLFFA
jgi:uncharacterized protein (DUF433 family)